MMTLSQIERLVRRITDLLGQPALETQAAKLAQDYSEVGRAASRRLEQCAVMIEAGQELQALQLAETPPPLLDVITLLSFRQAGDWRTWCQGHGLPAVEPFFDKYVRLLNTAYGKGNAGENPFYKDYRRAVLQNDDNRALSILRVIARMNPADQNTAQDLQRLEEKVARARLDGLEKVLAAGDTEAVLACLAELEASTLAIPASHPVWQQAQLLRCQRLLAQAEGFQQQGQWREAEPVIEEINALATQNSVLFPEKDVARFEAIEAWVSGERGVFVENQDFDRAVDALEFQVQTAQTRRSAAGNPGQADLQAEFDALSAKWRDAERFNRPLDPDLVSEAQRHCAWYQAQIRQRIKTKSAVRVVSAIAVFVLLAVAGFLVWDHVRIKQLAAELGKLQADRRVTETQRLLEQVPTRLKKNPVLAQTITQADQFIAREFGQRNAFDQKLAALTAMERNAYSNGFAVVQLDRPECARLLPGLAPEFRSVGESNLAVFDQRWQTHLRGIQPEFRTTFSSKLAALQSTAAERLNPANGFEAVKAALTSLRTPLDELAGLRARPVELDEASVRSFNTLTNQISECSRTVAQWADLIQRLPHIQSQDDYIKALGLISESPFSSPNDRGSAEQARTLNPSESRLVAGLILSRNAEFPGGSGLVLSNLGSLSLRPTEPSEAELAAYSKLYRDHNVQEIYVCWLTNNSHNPDSAGKTKFVFLRGGLQTNRTGKINGLIYDPKLSPDRLRFDQTIIDNWDWDYSKLERGGLFKDCEAFQRLGLNDLRDSNTGTYQKSVLELLDRLAQDTQASALFRAYFSLRFFEIAELRPAAWGLHWSPSARMHIQKLKDIGAANIQTGDWMVPDRLHALEVPLRKYFDQARTFSFEKEARFFHQLAASAYDAKFTFAGYVDARGSPVLTRNAPSQSRTAGGTELWGWSASSRMPALLLRAAANPSGDPPVRLDDPLPFTPLLVFLGDRRAILEQTAAMTGYSSRSENVLPPLFSKLPSRATSAAASNQPQ